MILVHDGNRTLGQAHASFRGHQDKIKLHAGDVLSGEAPRVGRRPWEDVNQHIEYWSARSNKLHAGGLEIGSPQRASVTHSSIDIRQLVGGPPGE